MTPIADPELRRTALHHAGLLGVWLLIFAAALGSGFTLMDDSTFFRLVMGSGGLADCWYLEGIQGGGRYAPMFTMGKWVQLELFGYRPAWHHALQLLLGWLAIAGLTVPLSLVLRRPALCWVAFLAFLLQADAGWGSILWSIFDVSAFDPMSAAFASGAFAAGCAACWASGKNRLAAYAAFAVLLFGALHSKETTAAAGVPVAVVLAGAAFVVPRERRRVLLALAALCAGVTALFFAGFVLSGAAAAARANEYTGNYRLSPRLIAGNLLAHFLGTMNLGGLLLPAVWIAGFAAIVAAIRRRGRASASVRLLGLLFAVYLSLLAVNLPNALLRESPRMLFVPVIFFSACAAAAVAVVLEWTGTLAPPKRRIAFVAAMLLLFTMAPFALLRTAGFRAFYPAIMQPEWHAVRHAKDVLDASPGAALGVVSMSGESFVHGMHGHLENMKTRSDSRLVYAGERLPAAEQAREAGIDRVVLLSRNQLAAERHIADSVVWKATPIRRQSCITFEEAQFSSIWKFLTRGGLHPLVRSLYEPTAWELQLAEP